MGRIWADGPTGATPLSAARLNAMEADIEAGLAVPDAALAGRISDTTPSAARAALNAAIVSEGGKTFGADVQEGLVKSDLRTAVAFGDSITEGNQDLTGYTWPMLLGSALGSGVSMVNLGKSGWTSTEVAIRQGGLDVTLGAFTVPAGAGTANQVEVTVLAPTGAFRTNANIFPSWLGVLTSGGVSIPGRLRHQIDSGGQPYQNAWTFERTTAGAATPIPSGATFHSTEFEAHRDKFQIFGVGRNNIDDPSIVTRDIDAMIAYLTPGVKRYLVTSVHTTTTETSGSTNYNKVKAINDALSANYVGRYVDTRRYLIDNGLAVAGITPTGSDTTAIAGDTIPPSLVVADGVHPNQQGYRGMATKFLASLRGLDWLRDKPGNVPAPTPVVSQRWLASDLTAADGVAVASWSANVGGVALTQGTGSAQPVMATVGGKRYVRFDGVDDMLSGATGITQPSTIIIRAKVRATPAGKWHGLVWSQVSPGIVMAVTEDRRVRVGATSNFSGPANQAPVDAAENYIAVFNGASSSVRVGSNAATTGDVGTGGMSTMRVGYAFNGSAQYAEIDVAEILVYNRALSTDEVDAVLAGITS